MTGSLRRVGDFELCDGAVSVAILARARRVGKRRAGLDERCRFERRFRIARRKLPKALRRKGGHVTFQAFVRWAGDQALAPAERRVRRRARPR